MEPKQIRNISGEKKKKIRTNKEIADGGGGRLGGGGGGVGGGGGGGGGGFREERHRPNISLLNKLFPPRYNHGDLEKSTYGKIFKKKVFSLALQERSSEILVKYGSLPEDLSWRKQTWRLREVLS